MKRMARNARDYSVKTMLLQIGMSSTLEALMEDRSEPRMTRMNANNVRNIPTKISGPRVWAREPATAEPTFETPTHRITAAIREYSRPFAV
jgi:hypothetical protein